MKQERCPRCDGEDLRHIASSPVEGVFEVFKCPRCQYLWRSWEVLSGVIPITPKEMEQVARMDYKDRLKKEITS